MEEFSTEKDQEQFHDPLGTWKKKREASNFETWVSPRNGFQIKLLPTPSYCTGSKLDGGGKEKKNHDQNIKISQEEKTNEESQ